jgi:hypothetical protein
MKGIEKNALGIPTTTPDHGVELGREWFGGFASMDPGTVDEVSFTYELAPSLVTMMKNGVYYALFQKQLGTKGHALTLDLDFGRKVVSAEPGEAMQEYGDTRYRAVSNLRTDRYVEVKIATNK